MDAAKVKSFIESIYCPVHKQHPHISVDGYNHIHVDCCCQQFQKQCDYLVKLLSRPGHETGNDPVAVV